jgi:hypothetical protein
VVVGASVWLVLRERHHPTPEPAAEASPAEQDAEGVGDSLPAPSD